MKYSNYENKSLVDLQCNDLPAPVNGEVVTCSSSKVGVDYGTLKNSLPYSTL